MRRLAAIVLALFAILGTASAEAPPACSGRDLLADLKTERPVDYEAVMAEAAAVPNGEALFWKIEGNGLKPSWLLGTAHVTDPRVTELTPAMADALSGAGTLALELKELRNPQEMALASIKQASLMVLPPGQSLWDLIPDDQEALIRDNPNLPAGAAGTLFGYQPWVVAAMLSIPPCEFARKKAGLETLDTILARASDRQHIPLEGLETVEEQLSVLSGLPVDLQVKYLLAVARLGPRTADYFETLISLYASQNVVAYMPLTKRLEPMDQDSEALMAFVEEKLTRERNHTMARRAAGLLAQGNAFIAVGALHLPGEEGLVELIRKEGYKVTPVH
jgi:uncharacterized protein YbaP (TraB family)